MISLHELHERHGGSMPEGGFGAEEVWEMNVATDAEVAAMREAEREARRATQARGEAEVAERAAAELARRLRAAGMPERYLHVPADSRRTSAMAQGRGLWLWGPVGTGKTWAACSALKGWVSTRHAAARMCTCVAMLSELRDAMSSGSGAAATASFSRVPLLVLDDLGKESPTPWALSKLFEVADWRWSHQLPTVVTSQEDPDEMIAHLGRNGDTETAVAVVSRLASSCERVPLSGRDRRLG